MAHADTGRRTGGRARRDGAAHAADAAGAIFGAIAPVFDTATGALRIAAHRSAAGGGVERSRIAESGAADLTGGEIAIDGRRRALRALTRDDADHGTACATRSAGAATTAAAATTGSAVV